MIACTHCPGAPGDSSDRVRTIALPVPASGIPDAHFFAVVVGGADARTHRAIARAAATIENIAERDDLLPRAPAPQGAERALAWLQAYIHAVRAHLDADALPAGIGIGVGIAYPHGQRTAVALAATGPVRAYVIHTALTGASTVTPIAAAPSDAHPLRFPHAVEGTIGEREAFLVCDGGADAGGGGTIMRNARGVAISRAREAPDAHPGSQRSMDSFLATAASTERFLTPTLGPVLREYAAHVRATVAALHRRRRTRSHARRQPLAILRGIMRISLCTALVGIRGISAMAIDGLRLLGIALARIVRALRNMRTPAPILRRIADAAAAVRAHPVQAIGDAAARRTTRGRSWYRTLPPTSRTLFLLTVAFAALFLASTGALWKRRTVERDVAMYNVTIARIEELRSVAEARLLFNDRGAARTALAEAEQELSALPRSSRARRERAALLEREIRASLDRARLLTRIAQPLRVARGGEKIPFPDIGGMVVVGERIVAIATDARRIALVHSRTGAVDARDVRGAHPVTAPFHAVAMDDRTILLVDRDAHAALLDTQSGEAQVTVIEQPPAEVRDAAFSQERLYLLHGTGAISRHTRTAGGFARGIVWLEAIRALPNAQTIAVTGVVLVGTADGTIATYSAGRRTDADVRATVDPPLSNAPRIIASPTSDVLYVGDPGEGRIIAVTPKGELIGQVQSDAFRNFAMIGVGASGTSLYILHGTDISVIVPPKQAK